jgi:hypothetical protein
MRATSALLKTVFLDETGAWSGEYFDSKRLNCHRRLIFFAALKPSWVGKAPTDPDAFTKKSKSNKVKAGPKKPPKKNKVHTAKRKKEEDNYEAQTEVDAAFRRES